MPTASEFHRIITPAKWQYAAGAFTYACEIVAQNYDYHYGEVSDFATSAMKNGSIMEPESRRFYELETGCDVKQVGFVISDCGRWGYSPDSICGEDGLLELKNPTPAVHIKWLMEGVVPPEHLAQCHGGLLVTKRKWIDWMSYAPQLPPLLVRVVPDEKTLLLAEALETFWKRLTEIRCKIAGTVDTVAATREEFVSPF